MPSHEKNVFNYLNGYQNSDIPFSPTNGGAGSRLGLKYYYPPSLGEGNGLPFTLFMPYKRPKGTAGIRATKDALQLYESIPPPEFAIALPTIPSALKTNYSAAYAEIQVGQALGLVGDIAGGKSSGGAQSQQPSTTEKITKFAGDYLTNLTTNVGRFGIIGGSAVTQAQTAQNFFGGSGSAVGDIGIGIGTAAGQSALEAAGASQEVANLLIAGQADNPYTDQIFKNMQFRTHDFSYTFMPKNVGESVTIDKIISIFKYAMHPRPATRGFFDFPYEFQIVHSIQSTTFTLMPSVIETLDVDFGGGTDSLKLFKQQAGQSWPAKITLSMKFKEMVLLNRDHLIREAAFNDSEAEVEANGAINPSKRYRF